MDDFDWTDTPEAKRLFAARTRVAAAIKEIWGERGLDFDQRAWADGLVFRIELQRLDAAKQAGGLGGRPAAVTDEMRQSILKAYADKPERWSDNQFIEIQAGRLGLSPATIRRVLKSSLSKPRF